MKAQVNFDSLGGGSNNLETGVETIVSGTDSIISLDFVPTLVITEVNNGSDDVRFAVWDSEALNTKITQIANNNGTLYTKNFVNGDTPTSSNCLWGCLCNVDTTNKQFTIRQYGSGTGTEVKWVAYK